MHIIMFCYCHYQLSLKIINKKILKITRINLRLQLTNKNDIKISYSKLWV